MGLLADTATELEANAQGGTMDGSQARFATATLDHAPDLSNAFHAALAHKGSTLDGSIRPTGLRDGAWTFTVRFPMRIVHDGALKLQADTHGFTSVELRGTERGDDLLAAANATFGRLGLDAPTFAGLKGGSGCASF